MLSFMSKKALPDYMLSLPSDLSTLSPLDSVVENLYRQIALNIESNVQLNQLRDMLLPKLMSGELDVSELDL